MPIIVECEVQAAKWKKHCDVVDGLQQQEQVKLSMIMVAHAIPNPEAMMIIPFYADLAFCAVATAVRAHHLTKFAVHFAWLIWLHVFMSAIFIFIYMTLIAVAIFLSFCLLCNVLLFLHALHISVLIIMIINA